MKQGLTWIDKGVETGVDTKTDTKTETGAWRGMGTEAGTESKLDMPIALCSMDVFFLPCSNYLNTQHICHNSISKIPYNQR